jgi:hypothetical protein
MISLPLSNRTFGNRPAANLGLGGADEKNAAV